MSLRVVTLACAATALVSVAAFAEARTATPRCEQTDFRIYFQHGSAVLDDSARDLLAAAERDVSGCNYAELHVMLDPASGPAFARGQAIRAAANGRSWNVVRLERRPAMQRAAFESGPDYAEVTVTPNVMPVTNELITPNAGV